MLLNFVEKYIDRQTLITIHNIYTSIISLIFPKMTTTDSQPIFNPNIPSPPISYPIKTLEDLRLRTYFDSFHFEFNKSSVALRRQRDDDVMLPNRRRLMVCHDMEGGYTNDDKWIQGGNNADAYSIWHWYLIDVFIYFSHNLVTLPPPSWVNTAHLHGVKVLGTFIVEWAEGKLIAEQFLETTTIAEMYAERLSELAVALGFDGWLINMEVSLDIKKIPILKKFVSHLTQVMHSSMPGSIVIWYDSITIEGQLIWQDQLNDKNKPFFDICDGIFMNYSWKEDYPRSSAAVAGNRKFDVYMGIDVFGRGTYGDGQWTTNVALDVLKKDDVSAAIFAPGWVYETKQPPNFQTAQNRWWSQVEKSWGISQTYPRVLPFYSNFDQGHGYHLSVDGSLVSDAPWNNISNQSFQPCLELSGDAATETIQAFVDFKEASYSGGGNITFKGVLEDNAYVARRIFLGELRLGNSPLHFTYSVKSDGNSVIGLCLHFINSADTEKKTSVLLASWGDALLTMGRFSSNFNSVIMPRHVKKHQTAPEWVIQESSITMEGSTLTEIHAVCYNSNPTVRRLNSPSVRDPSEYYAVLGHMSIKSSTDNIVFPRASEWHLESQNVNWTSDSQGNKTLSLKVLWTLNHGLSSVFSKYNIYVETEPNESAQASKYVGVALVNAYYFSELLVPDGVSSLKFIIQACGINGDCQELVESPFLRLHVEGV
uniref:cytosolic endo-beta-N-acetylglucosaminidase 1 n=1 Tax=Erigeron canadensis TaxID=72917 RepID=UPI001CB90169|nr:cytosolic endo-beta-N-acetylglucosaminidase 1 [Erigeron canadensis]